MDTKLILVKAITLLYLESKLTDKTNSTRELITELLTHIKLPDSYTMGDFGRDPLVNIRDTVRWMLTTSKDYEFEKIDLLQRLRVNCNNDQSLYEAFFNSINPELEEKKLKLSVINYRTGIKESIAQLNVKEILKNAYNKVSFHNAMVDWRVFVGEVLGELEPYRNMEVTETGHPSIVSDIMFSDAEAVKGVMQRSVTELEDRGVIKFGWRGLNRMFGPTGGARRGEFIVIGALQHNFKSGTTLEMFKSAAIYNKPTLRDPTKKPLLMRISFENPITLDITNLYRSLYENQTGTYCDPMTIDVDEATTTVMERLQASGFHINMVHIDPSEFTYRDLFDRIEKFEADGYEIIMLNIDYLPMMSKKGCAQGPAGVEIRDLYRRVRNFTSKRGIITITPHQLSTEAKQLTRIGVENFVQEIANKGYYDGCKTIDQEVDMEIYQHIVKVNGISYLTFQRGKHRKPTITPEKDLYFCYRFYDVGTIPDDIEKADMSRRHVGGSTVEEGDEAPWHSGY